jgi:hypothetical protein
MEDPFLAIDWALQDFKSPADKRDAQEKERAAKPAPSRPILSLKQKELRNVEPERHQD